MKPNFQWLVDAVVCDALKCGSMLSSGSVGAVVNVSLVYKQS